MDAVCTGGDPSRKRVVVVLNKWWECEPALNAMLNDNARPPNSPWPTFCDFPIEADKVPEELKNTPPPRAVFGYRNVSVEVWCISDLLAYFNNETPCVQSSSQRKMERLPLVFDDSRPKADLVIAAGTTGFPREGMMPPESRNGSVVMGTRVFMHDGHPGTENKCSMWHDGPFNSIQPSALSADAFDFFMNLDTASALKNFFVPPMNPDQDLHQKQPEGEILADHDYVNLQTVNVTDYKEYAEKDLDTFNAYRNADGSLEQAVSLETTLGLVWKAAGGAQAPFMFVAGVTDRMGCFDDDVGPRVYAQDTTCAHNIGIALAWLLPFVDEYFGPVKWEKTQNVAQYGGADWKNEVRRESNISLSDAMAIADSDPDITFFFYMRQPMFLSGNPPEWTEKGQFNPRDAVFFSGEPWWGSAPQADGWVKRKG